MSILRITNVSPGNLWLRDLYTELSPGETATIKRTPAEMGDMVGLQEYLANGKVVVDIDLEAYESSGELVPVWPLGLNGRPAVPTTVALPLLNNRLGDTRLVIDILQQFAWNGTVWVGIGGGGGGGVTSVTASLPLSSSGGATPIISLGTVGVGNGGTGATTLTGYVKGTGTSALTASATIPGSDVSGNISGNAANVTGIVAIANGGTGQTSLTANAVVLGNGALAVQTVAPGTSGNVLTSDGTTWSSAPSLATEYDQQIFVSDGADPLVATGAPQRPFASISAAMAAITDAAPTKRYAISVAAGEYTEASTLNLKPNVFIIGISRDAVRITAPSFGLDASFTGAADNRSGISNAIVTGAASFDFTTVTSTAGKLVFSDTSFNSAVTLTGYNNAIVQAQFSGCQMFGVFTIQGVNVGVFNDNILFSNIILTQSPFGGVPTFLVATGGSCGGTVTATTTVNDFNKRISVFARSFWMNGPVTFDGPSSYLDYTVDSIPAVGVTVLNGASTTSLNPPVVAPAGANTALSNLVFPTAVNNPIVPAATNATNSGDWDKQWMFAFNYVNLSSGTELYVASAGTSAVPDSVGRDIFVEADTYGLQANVNGGDISITTQAGVSGTGVRGQIALNARNIEICGAYTLPSVDGTAGQVVTTNGAGVSTWSAPTGGPPSGAAGGDLTGSTYPNPIISSFGGKTHWVVQGGKYATLQAAVDAAVAGDVILVGPAPTGAPQNGTWGNVTFPAQKRLSVVGLTGGQVSTQINIGLVTYSPTTGLNINENEVFLCGLFINANYAGTPGVTFGGTAPARIRLRACFLYNSGISGDGVSVSNSSASSSCYLDNCTVQTNSANTTSIMVNHQAGYTWIKNGCDIAGGQYALRIAGGSVEASDVIFEVPALVTGTASAIANTTLTDASKTWTVNAFAGLKVYISSGVAGSGQSRTIISNTATVLTISSGATNWSPNPSVGATYTIGTPRETIRMESGSASIAYCTIRAPIGDATGVNLAVAGVLLGINNASLSVASGGATAGTGTGYAINGPAVGNAFLAYGQVAYSNSTLIPYNVKVKNTIIAAAVTQAFTVSP